MTSGAGAFPAWSGLLDTLEAATSAGLAELRRLEPRRAAEVDQVRRLGSVEPTIVVVGETKRGKSSLINALLGVPNLSPVDASVATSAYLEFRHARNPYVLAHVPGRSSPVKLPLSELRAAGASPGTPSGHRQARRIEVGYPRTVLERLAVIDTPGTGGMDPAHIEITLDAVSKATALVFVVDASAPLSKPELDFLIEASKRVDDVLFVMTKVDAYPGWRVIAEDNLALLRTHAGERFAAARVLPVSAKLAELAAKLSGPASVELFARSGIGELRETITSRVIDRATALHAANSLRAVRSELALLDTALDERGQAADPDERTATDLRAARDRFAARQREDTRGWTLTLGAEIHCARTDAIAALRDQVQQARETYLDVVSSANTDRLTGLPDELDRRLHVMSLRISADLEQRCRTIGQRVLQEVFTEPELNTLLSQLNAELRAATSTRPQRERGGDQFLVISRTSATALVAGRGAAAGAMAAIGSGSALASVALPVVGVGIGLAAGAFALFKRGLDLNRQQAEIWLRDVLAEVGTAISDEISHRFADLEYALTVALDRALERRLGQLNERVSQADEAMTQDKPARLLRKAELRADRDAIRARIAELDRALALVQPESAA